MAFDRSEFRKRTFFPEPGTNDFMKGMQVSLEVYDIALDYLIAAMEQLRESFRDMIELQYGLSQYEEYLKDNRSAEKAKELRPDIAERASLSEEEQEKQSVLQRPESLGSIDQEEQNETYDRVLVTGQLAKEDLEDIWKEQMDDISDPGFMPEPEALPQQEEKRRGR